MCDVVNDVVWWTSHVVRHRGRHAHVYIDVVPGCYDVFQDISNGIMGFGGSLLFIFVIMFNLL